MMEKTDILFYFSIMFLILGTANGCNSHTTNSQINIPKSDTIKKNDSYLEKSKTERKELATKLKEIYGKKAGMLEDYNVNLTDSLMGMKIEYPVKSAKREEIETEFIRKFFHRMESNSMLTITDYLDFLGYNSEAGYEEVLQYFYCYNPYDSLASCDECSALISDKFYGRHQFYGKNRNRYPSYYLYRLKDRICQQLNFSDSIEILSIEFLKRYRCYHIKCKKSSFYMMVNEYENEQLYMTRIFDAAKKEIRVDYVIPVCMPMI